MLENILQRCKNTFSNLSCFESESTK